MLITYEILGAHKYIKVQSDIEWIYRAQSSLGGIAKAPDEFPDVLHSYLAYVALSMHEHNGEGSWCIPLSPVSAALNLSRESLEWLHVHLWSRAAPYVP